LGGFAALYNPKVHSFKRILMIAALASIGYEFEPSKYSPNLGYSGLKIVISGQPTQRFYDFKTLHIPTFDGYNFHRTHVTRHELSLKETFQVCVGEVKMETHRGDDIWAFSFGGVLKAEVYQDDLLCELTSSAPIFKLQDDPKWVSAVLVEEIMDLLAEEQARLAGHEDELYARLAKIEPYKLFISSLVTLQKSADSVPLNLRQESYHKASSNIHRIIQIVRETDDWDGDAPSLEELLSNGGA
jgi:hypothetical protein